MSIIQEIAVAASTAAETVEAALPKVADYSFFEPASAEQQALRDAVAGARHGLWHAAALRVADEITGVFLDDGDAGLFTTLRQIAPSIEMPTDMPVDITGTAVKWHGTIKGELAYWPTDRLREFVREQIEQEYLS